MMKATYSHKRTKHELAKLFHEGTVYYHEKTDFDPNTTRVPIPVLSSHCLCGLIAGPQSSWVSGGEIVNYSEVSLWKGELNSFLAGSLVSEVKLTVHLAITAAINKMET